MAEQIVLEDEQAVKKHQELVDKRLILFEAIVGSQAYGTNLPTSDIDKKFIYIEPLENILSGNVTDQLNVSKDYVGYEIGRYLQLVQSANPNLIELIHQPEDTIIHCHPLFKTYVIDNAHIFLTKQTKFSFGNYAASQIQKARGLNKKIVNPIEGPKKGFLDFCFVVNNQGSMPLKEWLKKKRILPEMCGVVAIDHMKNCYNLFVDTEYKFEYNSLIGVPLLPEYENRTEIEKGEINKLIQVSASELYAKRLYKGITDKDDVQVVLSSVEKGLNPDVMFYGNLEGFQHYCKEWASYQTWLKERNEERYKANMDNGASYDAKNMMHCHRLLDMAIEILRDHKVIVRRPNREQLLEIRAAKYPYEKLVEEANEKIKSIDELYHISTLADGIDKQVIFALLLELRKKFYKL